MQCGGFRCFSSWCHWQMWRCGAVSSTGSLLQSVASGRCSEGVLALSDTLLHGHGIAQLGTLYPNMIDPLGVQPPGVLSTFCSSKAASILGLTACFPALRVCFYYKQHSALQGSLYKIMIHLIWKHFFHFFSNVFLNLNQLSGMVAPAPGAELG